MRISWKFERPIFSTNLPFAAAYATLPIVIMVVYLLGARRTGAFENL